MLVITQAPLGRRWHVPATPGDHRGVIKAAVPVVNRAASKGSRGWGERESKRKGNEGGLLEDCLSFVLYLACFAHCDLPVWHWIPQKTVYYNKVKKTSPKIYAELNKNFAISRWTKCYFVSCWPKGKMEYIPTLCKNIQQIHFFFRVTKTNFVAQKEL